jgi:hypothetical protein
MTCIIGIIDKKNVYIGGDSAAISSNDLTSNIRTDEKVFLKGDFAYGFSSSFRMGQILRFKFNPPKQPKNLEDFEYMATLFIDELIKCFEANNFNDFKIEDGEFLVGYKGKLYEVLSDFQVGISKEGYASIGCGANIALGALHATKDKPALERVQLALEAASHHSMGVRPPFEIVKK